MSSTMRSPIHDYVCGYPLRSSVHSTVGASFQSAVLQFAAAAGILRGLSLIFYAREALLGVSDSVFSNKSKRQLGSMNFAWRLEVFLQIYGSEL